MACKPNAIFRLKKSETLPVHLTCCYPKHYRLAMTAANLQGSRLVCAQVDMLPLLPAEPLFLYRPQIPKGSAMKKHRWGL